MGLKSIGLGFLAMSWLGDSRIALFSVFVPYAWSIYGTSMVIFLAGLQNIDRDLYDAAHMDGANYIQRTFFVTIPLLRDVFTFEVSLRILSALSIFSLIYVLTNGGPFYATEVMGTYIYRNIGELELGWATAAATINAIVVTVVSLTFIHLRERE
jgi:raffinose/stachyose/melibiose transport system permease protein